MGHFIDTYVAPGPRNDTMPQIFDVKLSRIFQTFQIQIRSTFFYVLRIFYLYVLHFSSYPLSFFVEGD